MRIVLLCGATQLSAPQRRHQYGKDAGSTAGKNTEPLKSWARSTVPALAGVARTEEINDGEIQTQDPGRRR
jgi:hypothetical protein